MSASPALRELRALDVVPAGHIVVLMVNDYYDPHLKRGEYAIVDTSDKTTRVLKEMHGPGSDWNDFGREFRAS